MFYNIDNNKVQRNGFTKNNIHYPYSWLESSNIDELKKLNILPYEYIPSRIEEYQVIDGIILDIQSEKVIETDNVVDISLDDYKSKRITQLKNKFKSTSRTIIFNNFEIGANVQDKDALKEMYLLNEKTAKTFENKTTYEDVIIRLEDNSFQAFSHEELSEIIDIVINDGFLRYKKKWKKEEEINSCTKLSQLKLLEI